MLGYPYWLYVGAMREFMGSSRNPNDWKGILTLKTDV